MTQPIQEPTVPRKLTSFGYGQDQLFRRPGTTAPQPVEWASSSVSNMSLGTSLTVVTWGTIGGEYDSLVPTFDINGSGNLEIGKDGSYELSIVTTGWALQSGVDTVLIYEVGRLGGAAVQFHLGGLGTGIGNTATARILLRSNYDFSEVAVDPDYTLNPYTEILVPMALMNGAVENAGAPAEIRVRAFIEEDEVGVAHNEAEFWLWVKREGPTHLDTGGS